MTIAPAAQRRPYAKPRLERHGQLAEVTRITGGLFGVNDMVKRRNKTGL